MAFQTTLCKADAKAMIDDLVDALDVGGAGSIQIYNGAQPASPDVAIGSQTLLAEITLEAEAFGDATTGSGAEDDYILATANGLPNTDTAADASGVATWFRAVDGAGKAVIDGDIGATTATADMAMDNTAVSAGQVVKVNAWKIRMPYRAVG